MTSLRSSISRMPWMLAAGALALLLPTMARAAADPAPTGIPYADPGDDKYGVPVAPIQVPFWSDLGSYLPAGWDLHAQVQAMGTYNSNALFSSTSPASDEVASYSGMFELTMRSGHLHFSAGYLPQYSQHRRYNLIDSYDQKYHQHLLYAISRRTSLDWTLAGAHYNSWEGSSMAASNFGAMLSLITGVNQHELLSSLTNANTSIGLTHYVGRHDHWGLRAGASGSWWGASEASKLGLPTQAAARALSGDVDFNYSHELSRKLSVGAEAGERTFMRSGNGDNEDYQYFHLRADVKWPGGWTANIAAGPGVREFHGTQNQTGSGLDLRGGIDKRLKYTLLSASVTRTDGISNFRTSATNLTTTLAAQARLAQKWYGGAIGAYSRYSTSASGTTYNYSTRSNLWLSGRIGYQFRHNATWNFNGGYASYVGSYNGSTRVRMYEFGTGIVFDLTPHPVETQFN